MNHIWEFYENMKETVYVSDIDTYEMIYLNRYGREQFGFSSLDNIVGKPCYKLLQNKDEPCSICTNRYLKTGTFYEWKYHNPLLNKTFALKDTLVEQNGQRYRMELSFDITIQEENAAREQNHILKDFINKESLINEALRYALSAPTPEKSLEWLLRYIGEVSKSERIYIFEEMPGKILKNTYEWCAENITPQIDFLQEVPYHVLALWYRSFENHKNVLIENLEQTKESDPLAYEYLAPQNIHSLITSPLIYNDEIIGFYGVDNPPQEFFKHISVLLEILGHFIVSIMRHRDLVQHLEEVSYYDQLTGARNRHAMNECIQSIDPNVSIGILYGDLMGLKKLNDSMGHQAGDALLIRAYECFKQHFCEETIFRIGGDEFLVLLHDITEEELHKKTALLRQTMPDYKLVMALGVVWRPQCGHNILELLKEADQNMYFDKSNYYKQFPNERRRSQ